MLAGAAAVLLSASALVGTPIDRDLRSPGEPTGPATLRDPRTLRPLPHSPRLPSGAIAELSPDRRTLAVAGRRGVTLYAGRRRLRTVPVGSATPAWVGSDRLLAFGARTVRLIDAGTGEILRTTRVPGDGIYRQERVEDRFLVYTLAGAADDESTPHAYVLGDDGAILHDVPLPDDPEEFSGPVSSGLDGGLSAIDPQTGAVSRRAGDYIVYGRSRAGAVYAYSYRRKRYLVLDPRTLKITARTGRVTRPGLAGLYDVLPARTGFLVERFDELIAFGDDGRRRWRIPLLGLHAVGTLGRYVYVQEREPSRVVIRSLRTGRRVGVFRGRLDLGGISADGLRGNGAYLSGSLAYAESE